tara:strand:- start:38 stop:388 length:351 start_codon:yes stop_codon:yes gene_type:complete
VAAISPPSWAKNAIPTLNGWRDPRTNELLKSMNITQEQIDAYSGVVEQHVMKKSPRPETPPMPKPIQLNEAPANNTSMEDMTKLQLEALGRQHGVELDRRKNKSDLIDELNEIISE